LVLSPPKFIFLGSLSGKLALTTHGFPFRFGQCCAQLLERRWCSLWAQPTKRTKRHACRAFIKQ
jgi:hypothetical protein